MITPPLSMLAMPRLIRAVLVTVASLAWLLAGGNSSHVRSARFDMRSADDAQAPDLGRDGSVRLLKEILKVADQVFV
jgi:hypothetical protein